MKNRIFLMLIIMVFTFITACSVKKNFIIDDYGHKLYKDSEGKFVKNDWVKINEDYYYFDMNGYLVSNEWIDNDYYVGEDGKMMKNYWYKDFNNNYYYLDDSGKYVRNCIKTIDENLYAFDNDGLWIRDRLFINPEDNIHIMYADKDGNIVKNKDFYDVGGVICNIDDNGFFINNIWKEKDSKWYYFGNDGVKCINSIINEEYAVDENGEMVINAKRAGNNTIYTFGNDGKVIKKEKIDFNSMILDLKQYDLYSYGSISDYCKVGDGNSYLEYSCASSGRYYNDISDSKPAGTYALGKSGEGDIRRINQKLGLASDLAYKISHTRASQQTYYAENDIFIVSYKFYKLNNSDYYSTEIRYDYKNLNMIYY